MRISCNELSDYNGPLLQSRKLDFFDGAPPLSYVIFPVLQAPDVVLSMHLLFGFSLRERA